MMWRPLIRSRQEETPRKRVNPGFDAKIYPSKHYLRDRMILLMFHYRESRPPCFSKLLRVPHHKATNLPCATFIY
jgi:hypothetical protein